MKFKKFKRKRCSNCVYCKRIGANYFCIDSELYRKHRLEVFCPIPLICFRKRTLTRKEK